MSAHRRAGRCFFSPACIPSFSDLQEPAPDFLGLKALPCPPCKPSPQPTLALPPWLLAPHCLPLQGYLRVCSALPPSPPSRSSTCRLTAPPWLPSLLSHFLLPLLGFSFISQIAPSGLIILVSASVGRGAGRGDPTCLEVGVGIGRIDTRWERRGFGMWRLGPLCVFYCGADTTHLAAQIMAVY